MQRRSELWCAWCGWVYAAMFIIGLIGIAGWLPPMDPADTAQHTAQLYLSATNRIRTGVLVMFLGQLFVPFFGGAMVNQCRRIKEATPALHIAQIGSFTGAMITMVMAFIVFFAAAFRPDRISIEVTQALNDLGWLIMMIALVPFVTWAFAIGFAVLSDRGDNPPYPRWVGYFCLLVGLIQVPPALMIYFKTGPLAWNGLFSFYLPALDFFGWTLVMTFLTARAVRNQRYDEVERPTSALVTP
ncbi:MAG TPA: hypothetical protein VGH89_41810 [Pseudonocardia sp.]|jgi:hypothetical protein